MFRKKLVGLFYKLIGKTPRDMEMVNYWIHKTSVEARVVNRNGSLEMDLRGEKYPIRGLPRGYILFGILSKLKHEIKNQIFNDSWKKLEQGVSEEVIIADIKRIFKEGIKVKDDSPINGRQYQVGEDLMELLKYDLEPPIKLVPPVKEIYRAWTKVGNESSYKVRDILCEIMQDDDSYRYRIQWLAEWFPFWFKWFPNLLEKYFELSFYYLENAEIVGDMKERIRLLKRIVFLLLKDPQINKLFKDFMKEVDWSKVRMTKGDKFHFRGKYFKVDYGIFEY